MTKQLVSVRVTGNNRCTVLWSVVTVDPSSSFDDLLRSLKVGSSTPVSSTAVLSTPILSTDVLSTQFFSALIFFVLLVDKKMSF